MAKGAMATSMVPLSTSNKHSRECHHGAMHRDGLGMLLVRMASSPAVTLTLVHASRPCVMPHDGLLQLYIILFLSSQ